MSIACGTADFRAHPTTPGARVTGVHDSLLQESEKDIIWFRENFLGRDHLTLMALDSPRGPLAISLIQDADTGEWKALVRTAQASERLMVADKAVPISMSRKIFGRGPKWSHVLGVMSSDLPLKALKPCHDQALQSDLLGMEERQVIRSYKFGVVYLKSGQTSEADSMANRHDDASDAYKQFLEFLGEKIPLKGWKGYRAGLDVNEGQTGSHSVYTKWQGYEIMFHVATLLPFVENDEQKLDRKRHIGNDIVVVVFQDSDAPFQLSTVSSQQCHVFAAVKPHHDGYKLQFACKNGVPPYSPELPEPTFIKKDSTSRDFFLHKLVNSERASYKAPSFASKIQRTRKVLLVDLVSKYLT